MLKEEREVEQHLGIEFQSLWNVVMSVGKDSW